MAMSIAHVRSLRSENSDNVGAKITSIGLAASYTQTCLCLGLIRSVFVYVPKISV